MYVDAGCHLCFQATVFVLSYNDSKGVKVVPEGAPAESDGLHMYAMDLSELNGFFILVLASSTLPGIVPTSSIVLRRMSRQK